MALNPTQRNDDSRSLRYQPTRYYVQLADFTGGLTYLRWFWRSFPTDMGVRFGPIGASLVVRLRHLATVFGSML